MNEFAKDLEVLAEKNEPMPEGLSLTDKKMFLAFRYLGGLKRLKMISASEFTEAKTKLAQDYDSEKHSDGYMQRLADTFRITELSKSAYRKNRTLENADAIVFAIDGVPVAEIPMGDRYELKRVKLPNGKWGWD